MQPVTLRAKTLPCVRTTAAADHGQGWKELEAKLEIMEGQRKEEERGAADVRDNSSGKEASPSQVNLVQQMEQYLSIGFLRHQVVGVEQPHWW